MRFAALRPARWALRAQSFFLVFVLHLAALAVRIEAQKFSILIRPQGRGLLIEMIAFGGANNFFNLANDCCIAPPTPQAQNHDEAVSVSAETALSFVS